MSAEYYALLIGSNYTATPSSQLKGCINDIVHMRNMLIDAYDYPMGNIIMLRDDIADPNFLPTYVNILAALKQIVIKSASCSQIWIHYSGHGTQIFDSSAYALGEEDSLVECIVPCDYTTEGFITQEQIFELVSGIKCPAYITIDACHSASLCELEWSYTFINSASYSRKHTAGQKLSNSQIYIMTGCRDAETSADAFDVIEQIPMGAFTDAFITCLRKLEHNTPFLMLYKEICLYLKNAGYTQVPTISASTKDLIAYFKRVI